MHIFRRGDRWAGSVELPRDPVTGKRKRKWASGKTKREVEDKLTEIAHSLLTGTYTDGSSITVKEYLQNWLHTYCEPNLAPTTLESYKMIIDKHIIPSLGEIQLQKLQSFNIQNYVAAKLKYGRLDGKGGLSGKSVTYHIRILSEALKHAKKMRYIMQNPCNDIEMPKTKKYTAKVYDAKQLAELFKAAADNDIEIAIILGALAGLRRGEVLGLKWDTVNFEKGTITISETVVRVLNTYTKDPKSDTSQRNIAAPDALIKALRAQRKKQLELKLMLGQAYQDNNLVCCRADGSPITPSAFSHRYKALLTNSNLPYIRFHDLRHSYATLLLKGNVPAKVASALLGHSSVGITLDLYSHVLDEMKEEAAEKIGKLFDAK